MATTDFRHSPLGDDIGQRTNRPEDLDAVDLLSPLGWVVVQEPDWEQSQLRVLLHLPNDQRTRLPRTDHQQSPGLAGLCSLQGALTRIANHPEGHPEASRHAQRQQEVDENYGTREVRRQVQSPPHANNEGHAH